MTDARTITAALGVRWHGGYGLAYCPVHKNTRTPALSLSDGDKLNPLTGPSHRESADNYARIVARLDDDGRVIVCRDGLQWILQRRDGERGGRARWTGVGYCRPVNRSCGSAAPPARRKPGSARAKSARSNICTVSALGSSPSC